MVTLSRLIDGAVAADAGLASWEIADALWLAGRLNDAQAAPASQRGQRQPAASTPHREVGNGDSAEGQEAREHKVPVRQPDGGREPGTPTGRDLLPLGLPVPRELRRPLNLQRGLRPLKRTVPGGRALMLDEEATVALSAEAGHGMIIPALAPARGKWLDLAIVVDCSSSMILWGQMIAELRLLAEQLGAFQSVRTWHLKLEGANPRITPERPTGPAGSPAELIDPAGRQVVWLVTDCVAAAWAVPTVLKSTVEAWGHSGPLAVIQPLPRRMWARSQLRSQSVRLRSPFPGAPNSSLEVEHLSERDRRRAGIPVPVLEIDHRWLGAWSRLVAGTSPVHVAAAFVGGKGADAAGEPDEGLEGEELATVRYQDLGPDQLVKEFMAAASPEAFRLAGLLSAAPLNLSLMRHIQRVMCAQPRPVHLAEVLLSGLLLDMTRARERCPGGEASFKFRDGVRDVLLGTVRRSEAISVMEVVSEEWNQRHGAAQASSRGMLAVPGGTTGTPLTSDLDEYGEIEAKLLLRIGGRYAQVVTSIGSVEPRADDAGNRMDVPPLPRPGVPTLPRATVPDPLPPPAPVVPPSTPIHRLFPGDVPDAADPSDTGHGIVMLGGPGSGKTTYLAALSIALFSRPGWRMVAKDPASADMLTRLVRNLTSERVFPRMGSDEVGSYQWGLDGEVERTRRLGTVRYLAPVSMDFRVTDAGGEILQRAEYTSRRAELLDALVNSRGIVFFFDPTREFEHGDTFEYVNHAVALLAQHMLGSPVPTTQRLPHYVAVCVSKFDDDRVFLSADRKRLVTYDDGMPYRFPRVADEDAEEFLWELCKVSRTGTGQMAVTALERYFRPERIKYFVTSAIGFNVNQLTRTFDRWDRPNYTIDEHDTRLSRIRGAIRPINVAEPLLWLAGQLAQDPAKPGADPRGATGDAGRGRGHPG
jgi:hypothetical protein